MRSRDQWSLRKPCLAESRGHGDMETSCPCSPGMRFSGDTGLSVLILAESPAGLDTWVSLVSDMDGCVCSAKAYQSFFFISLPENYFALISQPGRFV